MTEMGNPRIPHPAEFLSPWFQNQSCVPFTAESIRCELGNYASYSINVTGTNDIIAGLKFAQKNNIRLVIKNTGHEYVPPNTPWASSSDALNSENGKGTGKGALSLWTHNLKDKTFIPSYSSSYYQGPAAKLGAGVQGEEAATFAYENGRHRVVVGSCPTVGIVGGYTQGGGHSSMSGLYGLSADNVLEWEVVTADGNHVIATPTQFSDLYWALSGGGGGTYGVVVSMTTRLFQEEAAGQAVYSFNVKSTGGVDAYWKAISTFHSQLQPLLDQGLYTTYAIGNDTFSIYALISPNKDEAQLTALLTPMLSALKQEGLTEQSISFATSGASTIYELLSASLWPELAVSTLVPVMGGRLITRANIETNLTGIIDAMRYITDGGVFELACTGINTTANGAMPVADNAVLPAWRDALFSCIVGTAWSWGDSWDPVPGWQTQLTNEIMPALEAATPNSGAYLNEASWSQSDWQEAFYGVNYGKLKKIKQKYDPTHLFYAVTAVGSEAWKADAEGRLCRT